jgi:hypothetical protein
MSITLRQSLRRAAICGFLFVLSALTAVPALAKTTLGTPTLSFSNETQTTIDVTFTATSPGGAPAGFTLQWMTQADYLANGWSDPPIGCDASFAGAAANSRYVLAPGQSITVTVGNFKNDNGFSTSCAGPLVCGTVYIFRAFSHGNSVWGRSAFSSNYIDSTLACSFGCALTQGYWKTHGPIPVGNNLDTWPVTTLTLGTVPYSDLQLLAILNQPPMGNGLISLAHQLIAARLSIANGADGTPIAAAVAAADAMIGSLVVPPIGSGILDPSVTGTLTDELDTWLNANECNSN